MDELNNGAAPVVTESVSAPVVEQAPASFEDTMSAVYDKMNQPRDDGGKFAAMRTPQPRKAPRRQPKRLRAKKLPISPRKRSRKRPSRPSLPRIRGRLR